jgi:hypothetical protein
VNENPDGILGNLPRSRPGVRSDKRAGGAAPPKRSPAKPKAAGAKPPATKAAAAKPPATKAAAKPKAAPAQPPPPPQAPPRQKQPDTVERAVQLVGDVAETGIKVAAKVAGGVLRRLPRP